MMEDNKNAKGKGKEKMVEDNENVNGMENDNEFLRCPGDPDDDDQNVLDFPEFYVARDMKDPKLVIGMVFANVRVFRKALKMHSIMNGYEFDYQKMMEIG